jgi:hypothetical protein
MGEMPLSRLSSAQLAQRSAAPKWLSAAPHPQRRRSQRHSSGSGAAQRSAPSAPAQHSTGAAAMPKGPVLPAA